MKGLSSTKRELEAGVADAEAEMARTEEYCRKLEELIAYVTPYDADALDAYLP